MKHDNRVDIVHGGGLLKCCVATLGAADFPKDTRIGTTLCCKHCPKLMILLRSGWHWRPENPEEAA